MSNRCSPAERGLSHTPKGTPQRRPLGLGPQNSQMLPLVDAVSEAWDTHDVAGAVRESPPREGSAQKSPTVEWGWLPRHPAAGVQGGDRPTQGTCFHQA